jgi:TolB-like protein
VLPFDNISAKNDYDYLADGLAQDTIASLGQIDPANLQLVGPTSTLAYKRGGKPLSAIGRELGADYADPFRSDPRFTSLIERCGFLD